MIRSGALDTQVEIRRRVLVQDDETGEATEAFEPLATVWAQVLPVRGSEPFAASQRFAEAETRFRIRWRGDVSPLDEIRHDGRDWEVLAVIQFGGRREGLDLVAKTRAE